MPKAEDEFLAAIQYAVTGNYIDFGAIDDVCEDMLGKLLENRADVELNTDELARLKRELEEAGTPIDEINPEVRHLIDEVDLCIAKGQGNFETLHGSGRNIFYLFLCKCELFTSKFQTERFTPVLNNELRIVQSA